MKLAKRISEAHSLRRRAVGQIEPRPARVGPVELAVVDRSLLVRVVNRLRVMHAAVMPTIASGNMNATVLMIGEKGAGSRDGRSRRGAGTGGAA